jgi:hypothetical protein
VPPTPTRGRVAQAHALTPLAGGAAWNDLVTNSRAGIDPTTFSGFFDDFLDGFISAGASVGPTILFTAQEGGGWITDVNDEGSGTVEDFTPETADLLFATGVSGGAARCAADGYGQGAGTLAYDGVDSRVNGPWRATKNPVFKTRWAQYGNGEGTRRIGLTGEETFGAEGDPTDGLYFRHTNGGTIEGVCRSGGVETTVDDLSPSAVEGDYHEGVIVVSLDGTRVDFFVDATLIGTVSDNIPMSAHLRPAFGTGPTVTGRQGLDIDYISVRQDR